jgi:hypothetical protein
VKRLHWFVVIAAAWTVGVPTRAHSGFAVPPSPELGNALVQRTQLGACLARCRPNCRFLFGNLSAPCERQCERECRHRASGRCRQVYQCTNRPNFTSECSGYGKTYNCRPVTRYDLDCKWVEQC